jgi:trypsin-like peptidase
MRLGAADIAVLLRAMGNSFDPFSMQKLLLERFRIQLFNITAAFKSFSDQAVDIHQHFDHRNQTEQLIAALRDARPAVPEFAALADRAGFAEVPAGNGLEVFARSGPAYQDVTVFRAGLAKREAAVCLIETRTGCGTGFLIASDLVLTNYHVIEKTLNPDGTLKAGEITCVFDHKLGANGYATPGLSVTATQLRAASPYAEEDCDPARANTSEKKLDYAALQLERGVGNDPVVPGGDSRGFIAVAAQPMAPTQMDSVLVLQHPKAKPMKIDIGTVTWTGVARLRHNVNTESGSSGAPVFNAALELVGLHHAGYDWPRTDHPFNQAIPASLIAADLRVRGVET